MFCGIQRWVTHDNDGSLHDLREASIELCTLLLLESEAVAAAHGGEARTPGAPQGPASELNVPSRGTREGRDRERGAAVLSQPSAVGAASTGGPPKQEGLSIQDAAKVLGVDEDTIRRMGKSGEIEIISLGRKLKRVPKSEIARLRATQKFSRR